MPRVALITTGECEHRALGSSLARAFVDVDIDFYAPFRRPIPSITSNYLSYPAPEGQTQIDKLVQSVLATLEDRGGPDFVLVVDDLELPNVGTPSHVTQLVSEAFRRALGTATHRQLARLRTRVSFHLLCPMLEAYFFGETAALVRAGASRDAILDPERHLEELEFPDVLFLEPTDVREHPWKRPDRYRHPKRYLSYLVDPDDTELTTYKETRDGARALATLDWAQVFAYQPPGLAFASALFDDLADALGVPCPFPGDPHLLTRRRADGTLRNLA